MVCKVAKRKNEGCLALATYFQTNASGGRIAIHGDINTPRCVCISRYSPPSIPPEPNGVPLCAFDLSHD